MWWGLKPSPRNAVESTEFSSTGASNQGKGGSGPQTQPVKPESLAPLSRDISSSAVSKTKIDLTDYHPRRALGFQRVPRGSSVLTLNGQSFSLAPAYAIKEGDYRPDLGEILEKKWGFAIFAAEKAPQRFISPDALNLVVVNESNGRWGIISGTVIVQIHPKADLSALAEAYNLQILMLDEALHQAYMKVPAGTDFQTLLVDLKQDSRVRGTEVEIIQSEKRAL